MAKVMKVSAVIFSVLTAVFVALYQGYPNGFISAMGITFGTFSYHFLMRLLVGKGVDALFHNRMDHTRWWFRPRPFEKKLYQSLKVKKWKKHIPTYDPDTFSAEKYSLEEILGATCQSEIVHELIVVLSFVPLFFAIPFGEFFVFLATSVGAALFDGVFVIVQRFNRPRLRKLADRKKTASPSEK